MQADASRGTRSRHPLKWRAAGTDEPGESFIAKGIEQIFTITDALGISREALVIPLRAENPGRVTLLKNGKLEIVADRDRDFGEWLSGLESRIRLLMDRPEG
jgi:hypothetical protein